MNEVNGMAESERATGAALIQDFAESPLVTDMGILVSIGSLGLIVATIAAGIALRNEAGAPTSVAVLLGIAGFLITAHPPPFGPTGLVLFAPAVVLLARSHAPAPATPRVQPGPA